MNNFNLEQAINNWRKELEKHPGMEPGYIEELEAHLRDKIDAQLAKGVTSEEAFIQATQDEFDNTESIAEEYHYARVQSRKPPEWKQSGWMPQLWSNYLKSSMRQIKRSAFYTGLNVAGLTIGVFTGLLIFFYVYHESTYDAFHNQSDRIYRVNVLTDLSGDGTTGTGNTALPMGPVLKDEYAEVEHSVRIAQNFQSVSVQTETNEQFSQDNVLFVDSTFFDVFFFNALHGEIQNALSNPTNVLITEETALKFFGTKDIVGKNLDIDGSPYQIAAVLENPPTNSSILFEMILPFTAMSNSDRQIWIQNFISTFVLLHKKVNPDQFEQNLQPLVTKYVAPQIEEAIGISFEDFLKQGASYRFGIQPISEIHLDTNIEGGLVAPVNGMYVTAFLIIGIFILALACINFMNLATARATTRAKEVGVRKVSGSKPQQLAAQFLTESTILTFISVMLASVLIFWSDFLFQQFAGFELDFSLFYQPGVIFGLLLFVLVIGLLAGSYPAFILISFKPVEVLKGRVKATSGSRSIINGLVVFQFAISIILIIGTLIINRQISYMMDQDLGFNKEQVLLLKNANQISDQMDSFKQELTEFASIQSTSATFHIPGNAVYQNAYKDSEGASGRQFLIDNMQVGYGFDEALGLEVIEGRFFSSDISSDSTVYVINETAAKLFNWEDPIGETIYEPNPGGMIQNQVIGVVKDFNYTSLHEPVKPLIITLQGSSNGRYLLVRFTPSNIEEVVHKLEQTWASYVPGESITYSFMDDEFNRQYRRDLKISRLFNIFTGISIAIAVLGLFGLASYNISRRVKEIGIRKVLGASNVKILTLLSKDFLKLVGVSYLTALPLAWLLANMWLQNFAYRVPIGAGIFIITALITLCITLLSVSWQATRASLNNPVNSLRSE